MQYEAYLGRKLIVSFLNTIGCVTFIMDKLPGLKKLDDLLPRSEVVHQGYLGSTGIIVLDSAHQVIVREYSLPRL
jgi:hypothetical protein